jgi:hypothetical protein
MVTAALASMLLLAALPVRVESGDCPSGVQIEQMLAALLPSLPEAAQPDVARVKKRAVGLRIELAQANGRVIAERLFDREGSCSELAELAAVAIASWESDVHPEFARPHVEPTPGPAVVLPTAHRSVPVAYEAALGVSLSHARSFAPGAVLVLTWIPWGTGIGMRVLGTAETERTVDLGQRHARWRRWTGSAELDWRLSSIPLDFHGGLALGWMTAKGVDFPQGNRSIVAFSPAATLGVRLAWWAARSFALWFDLSGLYWVRKQTVYADEPPSIEQELPRFQGVASAGLAFGRVAPGR